MFPWTTQSVRASAAPLSTSSPNPSEPGASGVFHATPEVSSSTTVPLSEAYTPMSVLESNLDPVAVSVAPACAATP